MIITLATKRPKSNDPRAHGLGKGASAPYPKIAVWSNLPGKNANNPATTSVPKTICFITRLWALRCSISPVFLYCLIRIIPYTREPIVTGIRIWIGERSPSFISLIKKEEIATNIINAAKTRPMSLCVEVPFAISKSKIAKRNAPNADAVWAIIIVIGFDSRPPRADCQTCHVQPHNAPGYAHTERGGNRFGCLVLMA